MKMILLFTSEAYAPYAEFRAMFPDTTEGKTEAIGAVLQLRKEGDRVSAYRVEAGKVALDWQTLSEAFEEVKL